MLSIGCSTPDFYGNETLEGMANHYELGGSFKSVPEWELYEVEGKYHLDLHITGGVRSKDYNFNLIQRPVVKPKARITKIEIISSEQVDVLFSGDAEIKGTATLGSRSRKQLRKMCNDNGVLTIRITTTVKTILYRMKRTKTSILNIT